MFGFMTTTAFLSMWISNTATTAMMIPIAHAVLTQLDSHRKSSVEDGLDTTGETRMALSGSHRKKEEHMRWTQTLHSNDM